jgi:hypothetical protein
MASLRIGVLISDINHLRNHEYRILKGIIEHPNLKLVLFIKDGRKQNNSRQTKLKKILMASGVITKVLFQIQLRIEAALFKPRRTVDTDDIISKAQDVETIYLSPERKGYLDVFSAAEAEKVKAYDLDIILRHEFNIIHGEILTAARYGIWSFHHGDNSINRGGPPGFWEIVNHESCCGVTLQQLTPELDGGLIIDKAWFEISHWSFTRNRHELLDKSVALLFKNLNKLLNDGQIKTQKSLTYYNRLYRNPDFGHLLKYLFKFYRSALKGVLYRFMPSLKRKNCWALFFGTGNFLESALFRIKPMAMPKKVFWADPFLYQYGHQLYVFFENYSYQTQKGKISAGKVIRDEKGNYAVVDVVDALDFDYHLSYPQIVLEDGEIFMIPETAQNHRLEVYRLVEFPHKWEIYATAFTGENIVDTTYFCDVAGEKWLFLN